MATELQKNLAVIVYVTMPKSKLTNMWNLIYLNAIIYEYDL